MPNYTIPHPGHPQGPCPNKRCHHSDCDEMRARAAARCRICRRPIGYDQPIQYENGDHPVHTHCHAAEREFLQKVQYENPARW